MKISALLASVKSLVNSFARIYIWAAELSLDVEMLKMCCVPLANFDDKQKMLILIQHTSQLTKHAGRSWTYGMNQQKTFAGKLPRKHRGHGCFYYLTVSEKIYEKNVGDFESYFNDYIAAEQNKMILE